MIRIERPKGKKKVGRKRFSPEKIFIRKAFKGLGGMVTSLPLCLASNLLSSLMAAKAGKRNVLNYARAPGIR